MAGSHNAGMVAIWAALEGQHYPTDLPPPDATVRTLTDLIAAIEAL